ncbi:MAG: hypothetical protein V4726_09850 [Verrucomicrobiota bacterium]
MISSLFRMLPARNPGVPSTCFRSGFFPLIFAAAAFAAAVWGSAPAARAQQAQNFPLDEKGESVMVVTHIFSSLPPGGFTAVRVSVKNAGKVALPVTLSASSRTSAEREPHTLNSDGFAFEAKAEATTSREFIVPVMPDFSGSRGAYGSGCSLQLSLKAGSQTFSANYAGNKQDGQPFVGFSQGVVGKSLEPLNDAMRAKISGSAPSSGSYRQDGGFAAAFLAADLPSDWRGYMGLDHLAMTPEEWLTLSPGVTTAIRQWVILGGTLDLFVSGPPPDSIMRELRIDRVEGGLHHLGAGRVRLMSREGDKTTPPAGEALLQDGSVSLLGGAGETVPGSKSSGSSSEPFAGVIGKYITDSASKNYSADHPRVRHELARDTFRSSGLSDLLELRNFAAWQVGVILLIFGVLVGPVNLFYFAGPGRRHRLFFTTPLISLGASAVLILVILFQDGAGGAGTRVALIEIRPDDNSAYLRQYQLSRTGVLFGGGFVTAEPSCLTPLILPPSRWTRLKPPDMSGGDGQHLTEPDPLGYGGDWFQSRSEQAQLLETIRPGRGRLELKPGTGAPVIVSSLGCRLEQIFYTDSAGKIWTSNAALTTGGTATLREAVDREFEDFLRDQTKQFPIGTFDSTGNRKFIALSRDPLAGFADTLKSIQWSDDRAILYGPLTAHP